MGGKHRDFLAQILLLLLVLLPRGHSAEAAAEEKQGRSPSSPYVSTLSQSFSNSTSGPGDVRPAVSSWQPVAKPNKTSLVPLTGPVQSTVSTTATSTDTIGHETLSSNVDQPGSGAVRKETRRETSTGVTAGPAQQNSKPHESFTTAKTGSGFLPGTGSQPARLSSTTASIVTSVDTSNGGSGSKQPGTTWTTTIRSVKTKIIRISLSTTAASSFPQTTTISTLTQMPSTLTPNPLGPGAVKPIAHELATTSKPSEAAEKGSLPTAIHTLVAIAGAGEGPATAGRGWSGVVSAALGLVLAVFVTSLMATPMLVPFMLQLVRCRLFAVGNTAG